VSESNTTIGSEWLRRRVPSFFKRSSPWDDETPIREELFSVERLETHARSLAVAQTVAPINTAGRSLSPRLADNGVILLSAYRSIVAAIEENRAITPAAEWLIDNYYVVERQIRQISTDLPPGYYRQLPKLLTGPFAGYPRIFGIAWAFVAHTDSSFDADIFVSFMKAYQSVQPLTIGELWAVSITLQVAMIENLRRLAQQITRSRTARHEADKAADRLLGVAGRVAEAASVVFARQGPEPLAPAFAVQLVHRLRDQDPTFTPALTWLDDRLSKQDTTADASVREVHRSQGAANVTVRNLMTSLRGIAEVDWTELFERLCLVDGVLSVNSRYREMEFSTRTLYRSAIEELARSARYSELDIARLAMDEARKSHKTLAPLEQLRRADAGYYLLAGGRDEFQNLLAYRNSRKFSARLNFDIYAAAILSTSAALLAAPLIALAQMGLGGVPICLLALVGGIPATDAAVALVNRFVAWIVRPRALPGLELKNGVPDTLRTIVVVPTLLTNPKQIAELVERLEIHHLTSPEGDLHFALLSDCTDSDLETADGDAALIECARSGIEDLNRRYGPAPAGPRFLLFHRRRVWSQSELRWIGWERKRGKLHELNRLLRGAQDTTFTDPDGRPPAYPEHVKYVLTLDSDTRLPRDAVRRLIGKMAHPLNQPRVDVDQARIVEGYAVLQPRVTPSLPKGGDGSWFQRVFSSSSGIDPYASAVSDVYQDMFGEGSYAGKGIYDIDAFETALSGRVPDATLLSHDLFEGTFARAGFASDIEVVEEFPSRYDVSARRHHRWARGDWQLLPWILGLAKRIEKGKAKNTELPRIGRWKMIDNLRRTLSAPAAVVALLSGLALPMDAALVWTGFVLATLGLPSLIPVISAAAARRPGISRLGHARSLGRDLKLAVTLSTLNLVFLADQACLMTDAILRTLWRLYASHRSMLEWTPAAQTSADDHLDVAGFVARMWGAVLIAAAAMLTALSFGHQTWILAAPLAALWALSPAVARYASLPPGGPGLKKLTEADTQTLRRTARLTWRFFETFVTPDDNMLPPDNFQDDPAASLAHRTSPTNIGLYLLAVASARDLGWIGTIQAIERLEATLATMVRLPRFRGHFYNWYDTRDLRVLEPKYVSSVDSGNLAGHLIALANACREWRVEPLKAQVRLAGIADTVALTAESAVRLRPGRRTQTVTPQQLEDCLADLVKTISIEAMTDEASSAQFERLVKDSEVLVDIAQAIALERSDGTGADLLFWSQATRSGIVAHRLDTASSASERPAREARLAALETSFHAMAMAMEFGFLFNEERQLLSIGYQLSESSLDPSCYDLLASEARLASFFAIAKGDIPARHWFRLGRSSTHVAHGAALISWSGSMFEYLMPPLVMHAPGGSLLDETDRIIVRRQIEYGASLGLPWGVSESAYNARDLEFTYQYSNFGVPGLGIKRGLGESKVVAPYATGLATMVDPSACVANWNRLATMGAKGRYGFYEALDFTPSRVQEGESFAIVRTFMAHHQGMTIVAIANALLDGVMRTRFHAEPIIQATELLLQERVPREIPVTGPWAEEVKSGARVGDEDLSGGRKIMSPHLSTPATLLLSNSRYAVMLTAAGSGYSRWGDAAITRWREDATRDDCGSYIYLKDLRSGVVWSAGYQPTGAEPDAYSIQFNEDRAEISRRDGALTTSLEVLVSSEDDAEVRRVTITNSGARARDIEITSYAELALGPQSADIAHPAFAKLFVETEYVVDLGAILATRRRRTPTEPEIWAAHVSVADGAAIGKPEFETDRARFLGRGHGVTAPIAMLDTRPLTNSIGAVLDPIFSLRRRVNVPSGATVRVAFWTMAADSRSALLDCVDKHRDASAYERATTLAWTQGQVQLHHLGVKPSEAVQFQRLAGHVIFAGRELRPSSDIIRQGSGPQSGLWPLGISGDLPFVLLRVADMENLNFVRQILRAHEYWRIKQLSVDLVILNERKSSYVQELQIAIESLVRISQSRATPGSEHHSGRIFVLRSDLVPAQTRALLISTARVVLVAQQGSLFDQLERIASAGAPIRLFARHLPGRLPAKAATRPPELEFFNGLGGFAANGTEYVTILGPGQSTPAPWINVVANSTIGFQTATEGSGYTWSANSRENQLTPWSNDPVSDPVGEAFYLRDQESGALWSPTALPIRDPQATYVARHGRGFSRFAHTAQGIASELLQYVPLEGSIKISRLRLTNESGRARSLSVTAYVEWILGASRSASLAFVETEIDVETGAMFAHNPWNMAFGSRIAFADMRGVQTDMTGDRREFLGRNGALSNPAALASSEAFSNKVGAALDPCAALRTVLELSPGGVAEIAFFLGQSETREDARSQLRRYRAADLDACLAEVGVHWSETLTAIEVKTPDRSMDIMLNGWLLYQTLACRIWARSAFYQASGAYGFRDQLQDGMALAAARPDLTREHLLRAAARQFVEGDVQHWWLPHSGQGVRTRISDDRAWLAHCVAQYIETTQDWPVLDESIPFLEGPVLADGQTDNFFQPSIAETKATLFEHCALALDRSLSVGRHGLPLIGSGDWNDGMNRVGEKGAGESVWLGWFLYATLVDFAPIAAARGETHRADQWTMHADALKVALEREAWDGNWYLRGFFDDGAALGSAKSEECRIDSIAQSWAVLSGAATSSRASRAMGSLERELINRKDGLALLFAPPFDRTELDPGYIKGYPPGVRENGGQYTHAATWTVMALAALGEGDKAASLFAMLNPINHSRTRADAHRYKVEPYAVCADIYSQDPQVGRGGWTWYTGSAGWLQRAGVESLLGLRLRGSELCIDPCIPLNWGQFEATIKYRSSHYRVTVENPNGVNRGVVSATADGDEINARPVRVPLIDDGGRHQVKVRLG
jgi:cyclic beta-1,2-glucan synthetase